MINSCVRVLWQASQGWRSACITPGRRVKGKTTLAHCGTRQSYLLLLHFNLSVSTRHPVLQHWYLSVDEPIQGSTPALTILGSLVTPTPKYSLIIRAVCRLFRYTQQATIVFVTQQQLSLANSYKQAFCALKETYANLASNTKGQRVLC